MALGFPDILVHNNNNYALIDSNQLRGFSIIDTLLDRDSIPYDKRSVGSLSILKGDSIYMYIGQTIDNIDWENTNNWIKPAPDAIPLELAGDIGSIQLNNGTNGLGGSSNLTFIDNTLNINGTLTYNDEIFNIKDKFTYSNGTMSVIDTITISEVLNISDTFTYSNGILNIKNQLIFDDGDLKISDSLNINDAMLYVDGTLTVIGNSNSNTTHTLDLQNLAGDTTLQVRDDGSYIILETDTDLTSIANYASIHMNIDGYYKLMRDDGELFYLNIDRFLNLRDVTVTNPTSGDVVVYIEDPNAEFGYIFKNFKTTDYDLTIFKTAVNIIGDDRLNFFLNAKYGISSIVIEEISGNYAGNISIGSTSGGTDIVSLESVSSYQAVKCTISKEFFSTTENTELWVSSPAWGSGSVNIYMRLERLTE